MVHLITLLTPERVLPAKLGTALFVLGLLLCLVGSPYAAHGAAACRADPLVTLSNGITLDLHVQIGDSLSDVQHITYVLHGPALPTAGAVAATYPDGTGSISNVTYLTDGTPQHYYAVMTVTTGAAAVPVTGYLDWTAGGVHHSGTARAAGVSGKVFQTPVLLVVCATQCIPAMAH